MAHQRPSEVISHIQDLQKGAWTTNDQTEFIKLLLRDKDMCQQIRHQIQLMFAGGYR